MREAAVVIGDKAMQDAMGRSPITGPGQAEFADQAILEHTPEAFDAALGLRAVGSDGGDAEWLPGAAELSGRALMILVLIVEALVQWYAILSRRREPLLHESPYVATQWTEGYSGVAHGEAQGDD